MMEYNATHLKRNFTGNIYCRNYLRIIKLAICLLVSMVQFSYAAEIGNMDIITIKYKGKSYYITFYSEDILKNNDLLQILEFRRLEKKTSHFYKPLNK
jgi:hypothetical protein